MQKSWRSAAARRVCELTGQKSVELATAEIGRRLTDGMTTAPIELEQIFPRLDIVACNADPELCIAGELRTAALGLEIVYSESQSEARRRFTIAHEMAHAMIERTGRYCPRRGAELERICDMVAGQILVPTLILHRYSTQHPNLEQISRMAKEFNVSLTMMAIRCAKELGTVVFQAEESRVAWFAGTEGTSILRPKSQFRRISILTQDRTDNSSILKVELQQ